MTMCFMAVPGSLEIEDMGRFSRKTPRTNNNAGGFRRPLMRRRNTIEEE